jgi:gliding motility-associated-like protein
MKRLLLLLIMAVTMLLIPNYNFGQVINLGTTSDFVLFSSVGAVTNTGISHLTGNVGSNLGASTGFGNVNGVMHDQDLVSGQCAADLLIAYADLAAAIPTDFPADLLGNGQVLEEGVYSIASPATLNLDLTLDALGDPNAVFIFQIEGAFSSGANAKVELINGAQACNVYWKIEGMVDLATGTKMCGTIIANNSAINMNTGDTLQGRALAINGAITIDGILAYTPIGCGSPFLSGPLAPDLVSALCYTIFSSDGPVTNAGDTYVTGDVGTNNGLTTGFNPLFVTGAIHPIPDGSTAAAAADLLNAYTYMNTLPYDIELLYPAQFGNDLVLTPHTYLMNGAVTFTDNLYLDAMDNPDAVFVIKIYGAMSTDVYANVILINGTKPENVYWMVSGAVEIGDYTEFIGTIVCNNGAMDLLQGVNLNGRALTTVGAVNTNAITATAPPGCLLLTSPLIIDQPIDLIVCDGDAAVFTVNASGSDLTYQWRIGLFDLVDGGNISGATTETLTIDPASITDVSADYNVVVSGSVLPDVTSDYVELSLGEAPIITIQPLDQTSCVGNPVSFTVSATGTDLTYQWRIGLVDLVDGATISGVTTNTLTIDPVNLTDVAINYNVVVSGTCLPDAISDDVELSLGEAPIITMQPTNQYACVGSPVVFTVSATGTDLTYQWRIGLVDLMDGATISGVNTNTLTIDPVNLTDMAIDYNVVVSGSCMPDVVSDYAELSLGESPSITIQPTDQSACVGSLVNFTVTATGTYLTYQWRRGLVDLMDGATISGATTSILTINPASLTDVATDYNVIVSGSCLPEAISDNVSLSLDEVAIIITQPSDQIVCDGDVATFTVIATGSNLTYQWRIGLVDLVDGGNISGATTNTLVIDPASASDISADYNVVISGECGVGTPPAELTSFGNFAILAGTAITSSGLSEIHDMDIGLSPGVRSSIVGFPPAIVVNGAIYASDDVAPPGVEAMLIQAKQELTDAYLFAEGATAPAPITVAGDQGGLTLAPGIYKSTSSLLIQSGDLTLDAQGDINAFWIFQIASDFTTIGGAGGNVILTGGAQANNITWQVGSSATIGNGTSFSGNILALTSITMNTGSSIDGRLLARNGAVVLSGANIINSPSDSVPIIVTQSIFVSLDIAEAPIITIQPTDQTSCVGSPVSFTVTATGTDLTYQWRIGLVDLVDGGTISGATSNVLTIDPVSLTDIAIDFNVVVSGLCLPDAISDNVELSLGEAPLITIQPTDQTACVGDPVSFTVTATGTDLTYQWRIGLVDLVDGGTISGATSNTLTIDPVSLTDVASDYNVVVTGSCLPAAISDDVSLIIGESPVITIQPTDQTVCVGSAVSFTVTATGTDLTYQWRIGTVDLVDGGTISGTTTNTLTIDPTSLTDVAIFYNVVVSGTCLPDAISHNISLSIEEAPVITIQPTDQTSCVGSAVSFTVTATGTDLTYQWRIGTIDLVDGGTISGATTNTLTIDPVSLTDVASDYNVVVSGSCLPDVISDNVSLSIGEAPIIILQPENLTVCDGSSANFIVIAEGTNLSYQWRIGLVDLVDGEAISGVNTASLTIDPATFADESDNYNVVISGLCLPEVTSFNTSLEIDSLPIATATTNSPVCIGGTIILTANTLFGATYEWTNTDGYLSNNQISEIPDAQAEDAGSFELVVTKDGCSSEPISVYITMRPCLIELVSIPEGFSPNGDGINDYFVITGIGFYPNNTFVIFNRWGNKVFEASPYANDWNGNSQFGLRVGGDELPIGTYFYILDLGDGTDEFKGTIYLNR